MTAARRHGGWVSLLVASGVIAGCSRGSTGPAELFLDSVVGAITTAGEPDLYVASIMGPPSATSGSGYFVTVTACNQGTGSAESVVKLYLSSDTSITAADILVGSARTGTLHPKQCSVLHVRTLGAASLTRGQRYLGAVIDSSESVEEVSETNNTRVGPRMMIGSGADFHLSRVSALAHLSPSDRFETTVQVCNTGTAPAEGEVDIYLSEAPPVTATDTWVGRGSTGLLHEGQCTTLTIPSVAQVARGTWYVAGWVDRAQAVQELAEDNNTRTGNRVVVDHGPDFTLASVSGPARISSSASEPLEVLATVCNGGNVAASTQVEAYLSADSVLTATDLRVGSTPVGVLEPGQCAPVSIRGSVDVSSGLWNVAVWVDRVQEVGELAEDNNIRFGNRAPAGSAPDLLISSVRGPHGVAASQPVHATATVCNQGTAPSATATLAFSLSLDASITTADALLGHVEVPGLQAGECAPVELQAGRVRVPEGAWHLGAHVDSDNRVAELSERNNTRAGDILGVGEVADLYVSSVTGPAYLRDPQSFTGGVTVCNQGARATTTSARVGLFLSTDAAIAASDLLIGDVSLPPLAVGQCTTVSVPGTRVSEGEWFLGAIADLDGSEFELLEDNNTQVGSTVAVGSTIATARMASILARN